MPAIWAERWNMTKAGTGASITARRFSDWVSESCVARCSSSVRNRSVASRMAPMDSISTVST